MLASTTHCAWRYHRHALCKSTVILYNIQYKFWWCPPTTFLSCGSGCGKLLFSTSIPKTQQLSSCLVHISFSCLKFMKNSSSKWMRNMNSMKLAFPLRSSYWSIHTKDGVNWLWRCGVTASFGDKFHGILVFQVVRQVCSATLYWRITKDLASKQPPLCAPCAVTKAISLSQGHRLMPQLLALRFLVS